MGAENSSVFINNNERVFAKISDDGKLKKFNNKLCREIAAGVVTDSTDVCISIAKLCILLLEGAAREVDHIMKEGGGTHGDIIRNFRK